MRLIHHQRIHHRPLLRDRGFRDNPSRDSRQFTQKEYYWIWFDKDATHKGLWGAYHTYAEAERIAVSRLNVPYEIVKLNTRDKSTAGGMMRSRLLGETGDIDRSFNRFSRKGGE